MILNVFAEMWPEVVRLIEKFSAKLIKNGQNPVITKVVREYDVESNVPFVYYPMIEAHVNVPRFQLADWEVCAKLEPMDDGTNRVFIIKPDPLLNPKELMRLPQRCEHCNTNRRRHVTFLLHNTTNGLWSQVGSTCLKDFTGYSPDAFLGLLKALENVKEEAEKYGPAWTGKHALTTWDITRVLKVSLWVIKKIGYYLSNNDARDRGDISTSQRVSTIMSTIHREGWLTEYEPEDQTIVSDILSWVHRMNPGDNRYLNNLKAICTRPTVSHKDFGIVASLPTAYERAMAKEKEAARPKLPSNYQGAVGDRIQRELALVFVREFEGSGYRGETVRLLKFADKSGNLYTWFTGTMGNVEPNPDLFEVATMRVKKHEEYNGIKTTVVNRVSFV